HREVPRLVEGVGALEVDPRHVSRDINEPAGSIPSRSRSLAAEPHPLLFLAPAAAGPGRSIAPVGRTVELVLRRRHRLIVLLAVPRHNEPLRLPPVAELVLEPLPVLLVLNLSSQVPARCHDGLTDGRRHLFRELKAPVGKRDRVPLYTTAGEEEAVSALVRVNAPLATA